MTWRFAVCTVLAAMVTPATSIAQCGGSAHLRRTLDPPTLTDQSLGGKPATPSDILSAAGVWAMRGVFEAGLEVRSSDLKEPKLKMRNLPASPTVAQVLTVMLAEMPGYTCRFLAPGFVIVRPPGAARDRTDPLNRSIDRFAWHARDAVDIFEHPEDYFAFLKPPLPSGPTLILGGLRSAGAPIPDGSLTRTTLLGVFNHLALLDRRVQLKKQAAEHSYVPGFLWSWFCIEGDVDPRTGLRRTSWGALEMAPRRIPPPPTPVAPGRPR